MKNKLFFILTALITLATSCAKAPQQNIVLPEGKFAGVFRRIHLNPATNKLDTATANIALSLSSATGYAVTGDTTTLHAGSNGSYVADGTYLQFIDKTLPANSTKTPTKVHLAGVYKYLYGGSTLEMGISNDTLSYYYNLKTTQ